MSVELFLLFYMFPCVEFWLYIGQITPEQNDEIARLVSEKIPPSREFLISHFPGVLGKIEKFAKTQNRDPWDFEVISQYWRNHHVEGENTPVVHGEVVEIIENPQKGKKQFLLIKEISTGKSFRVINEYDLLLEPGDYITVHGFFAIEKIQE